MQFTSRQSGGVRLRDRENRKQEGALGTLDCCSRAAGRLRRPVRGGETASPPARTARDDAVASLSGTRCRSRERRSLVTTKDTTRLSNHALRPRYGLYCPRAVAPRTLGVAEWVDRLHRPPYNVAASPPRSASPVRTDYWTLFRYRPHTVVRSSRQTVTVVNISPPGVS